MLVAFGFVIVALWKQLKEERKTARKVDEDRLSEIRELHGKVEQMANQFAAVVDALVQAFRVRGNGNGPKPS